MKSKVLLSGLVTLALIQVCNLPLSQPGETLTPPLIEVTNIPSDTPSPAQIDTPTQFPLPDSTSVPTNTPLPPMPDFDSVLTFGDAGGAGHSCMGPISPPPVVFSQISSMPHMVGICGFDSLLPANTPILLKLTSPDETVTLQGTLSNGSEAELHWTDPLFDDPINWSECNEQGCSSWGIEIWWPSGLPQGVWQVSLTWDGGSYSTTLDAALTKPELSVIDNLTKTHLRPTDYFNPCHFVSESTNLSAAGQGFPPNMPVYLPIYEKTEDQKYQFFHAETFIADLNGDFLGQLSGPFESGKTYLLIRANDPSNPYTFENQILMDVVGNAVDCFIVP